jgi:hypothetical protein
MAGIAEGKEYSVTFSRISKEETIRVIEKYSQKLEESNSLIQIKLYFPRNGIL